MDQQSLDAVVTVEPSPGDERREPPPPALIPGWRCVRQAIIRAHGEEGFVDLAALNPARGVALIALLDADEEASPDEARAAFHAMLAHEEFAKRFPGELPVVALTQRRASADQLAAAVDRAFAGMERPSVSEDWVEWLAERLTPATASAEPPRLLLVAPPREETAPGRVPEMPLSAPPRDEAPPAEAESAIVEHGEAPPRSVPRRRGWLDWGASFGFAAGVVLALLIGLALMSHAGRLF
jgi:hypothetical protein